MNSRISSCGNNGTSCSPGGGSNPPCHPRPLVRPAPAPPAVVAAIARFSRHAGHSPSGASGGTSVPHSAHCVLSVVSSIPLRPARPAGHDNREHRKEDPADDASRGKEKPLHHRVHHPAPPVVKAAASGETDVAERKGYTFSA